MQQTPAKWTATHWFLIALASAASVVITTVVVGLTYFSYQTTCGDAATPSEVAAGQRALAVVAVVAATPWLVALWRSRRRLRIAVAATIGVAPTLVGLAFAFDPEVWVGSWCF